MLEIKLLSTNDKVVGCCRGCKGVWVIFRVDGQRSSYGAAAAQARPCDSVANFKFIIVTYYFCPFPMCN